MITVKGCNWFHQGWIEAVFNLPQRNWDNPDNPVRDIDIEAYEEGYNMCMETPDMPLSVLRATLKQKQVVAEQVYTNYR